MENGPTASDDQHQTIHCTIKALNAYSLRMRVGRMKGRSYLLLKSLIKLFFLFVETRFHICLKYFDFSGENLWK